MARSDKLPCAMYAATVIAEVLAEGDLAHADTDWLDVTVMENVDHALDHLQYFRTRASAGRESAEDLEHALCRIAMALYRRRFTTER